MVYDKPSSQISADNVMSWSDIGSEIKPANYVEPAGKIPGEYSDDQIMSAKSKASSIIDQPRELCTMTEVEALARELGDSILILDRDKIRQELSEMHVAVHKDPSTYNINEGLAVAQMYRDRIAYIMMLVEHECYIRNFIVDLLTNVNSVVSKASSQDKRRGEALMKYAHYFIKAEYANSFRSEVKLAQENLKAASDTISRQVSVIQCQIALGERHGTQAPMSKWTNGIAN